MGQQKPPKWGCRLQPRELQAQDDIGNFSTINHLPAVNELGSDTAAGWPARVMRMEMGQDIGPCVGLVPGTHGQAGQGCGELETSPALAPLGQRPMAPGG